MACYNPLRGFVVGTKDNGKRNMIITGSEIVCVQDYGDGRWERCTDKVWSPYTRRVVDEYMNIPCGQCIGCRLQYSATWADRMMMELEDHKCAWFVTLTYEDSQLPVKDVVNEETGEVAKVATLKKSDLQKFFKRLRRRGQKIRYYASGEYGDNSYRPHYHAIMYGLELPDMKMWRTSKLGSRYYVSEWLNNVWSHGYCIIGEVSWETCAYVGRYVTKKAIGKKVKKHHLYGVDNEFASMSLKPGIGAGFYDRYGKELFEHNQIVLKGGRKAPIPKYFMGKLEVDDPKLHEVISEKRREVMELLEEVKDSRTDLSRVERLRVAERTKLQQVKALVRNKV
jgi:hypothetical protein